MNLRYISKYEETKKNKLAERDLVELREFAKKELFTLTQKHLGLPIVIMKL